MIFFFSGTGNSKYIAKTIAEALDDEIKNISEVLNENIENEIELNFKENEKIGIVFPTYYFGTPLIVEEFFKLLESVNNKQNINNKLKKYYLYILYNYEATGDGIERRIEKSLRKKI